MQTGKMMTASSHFYLGANSSHPFHLAIGLVSLLLVPISVLNWSSEKCFLAAGQDPTISKLSAQFVQYLTFGIPPLIIYEIVKKSLQVDGCPRSHSFDCSQY